MSRRQRIRQDDLTRIVSAVRATGLEIQSVTIDVEGGVTVAVHLQSVKAERDEARRTLVGLRRRVAEERAERAAREGRTGRPGRKGTTPKLLASIAASIGSAPRAIDIISTRLMLVRAT